MFDAIINYIPLPNGIYSGMWSGYNIVINGIGYQTDKGIRTLYAVPCKVTIYNCDGGVNVILQ